MKRFEDEFDIDEFSSRALDMYFGGLSLCVYDIETTGLFPRNDMIMLTGLLTIKDGHATAHQYFAETPSDEKKVLEATLNQLKHADYILTYNGRSFDTPFTEKRAAHYGIAADMPYDLDLFTIVSGYSEIKKFTGSLSQKSIERFMGKAPGRDDKIDGRESIRLYNQYLSSPSYALEKTIMLHNHDDICQLYRILPVIRQTDFHRAMSRMGFPAGDFNVVNYRITSSELSVNAIRKTDPIDYISFPTATAPYSLRMSSVTGVTELEIPGEHIADDALIIDAKTILENSADPEISHKALDEFSNYPSFQNGYLILKQNGKINYLETNLFIKAFFESLSV